ncbi:hypothetical protein K2173_007777 [Erythroxylum novogranatense]|uniref:Uncharacterized protein n=1 Tax=Erythroxylum novogranatense TaxID=1862640 RepID=A0AAV8TET4_9ROSI|nr:hypothetical protein K2173_007777 [Erythroxylum novogranatense]
MSDTCGNCDCTDKSQCVKKGNNYGGDIVVTEKSAVSNVVMEVQAAEHDGNCKCGPACACVNCTCNH